MVSNMEQHNKPIGILGGTFDPIHHGHLRLAIELYERLDLAEVRLVPTSRSPLRDPPLATSKQRLEMIQAAIADIPGLTVDERELQREGISYTVDTLHSLREEYPQRPLCLILGMDAFMTLPQWRQWEFLIIYAHLLVVHRPGQSLPTLHRMRDFLHAHRTYDPRELQSQLAGLIFVAEIPSLTISASQIRALVAAGRSPQYLLPVTVLDIIHHYQLYGN